MDLTPETVTCIETMYILEIGCRTVAIFLGYLNTTVPLRILQAGEDVYLCTKVCKKR